MSKDEDIGDIKENKLFDDKQPDKTKMQIGEKQEIKNINVEKENISEKTKIKRRRTGKR